MQQHLDRDHESNSPHANRVVSVYPRFRFWVQVVGVVTLPTGSPQKLLRGTLVFIVTHLVAPFCVPFQALDCRRKFFGIGSAHDSLDLLGS